MSDTVYDEDLLKRVQQAIQAGNRQLLAEICKEQQTQRQLGSLLDKDDY